MKEVNAHDREKEIDRTLETEEGETTHLTEETEGPTLTVDSLERKDRNLTTSALIAERLGTGNLIIYNLLYKPAKV